MAFGIPLNRGENQSKEAAFRIGAMGHCHAHRTFMVLMKGRVGGINRNRP